MSERRWDVVLRVRDAGVISDPKVLRGPHVVLGTDPGTGGLALPGGRGLAARHTTITANDPTSAWVTPVGANPVRLAPYADVDWEAIEPIRERSRLSRGAALHLGPPGARGITVEFVECRDLGVVDAERLTSEADDSMLQIERPPDAIQAARQRPRVSTLLAGGLSEDRLRAIVITMVGLSGALLLTAAVLLVVRFTLPPSEPPAYFWNEVAVTSWDAEAVKQEGFAAPLFDTVIDWDRKLAGDTVHAELSPDDPSKWDPKFFGAVIGSAKAWSKHPQLFKRFEEIKDEYAAVVTALRAAELPEVFAGLPMTESCYEPTVWSPCCARGWWQFMPEFGARFRDDPTFAGLGIDVKQCRYRDAPGSTFTPMEKAPPPKSCQTADYVAGGSCNLSECASDFRTDLQLSTRVAMLTLEMPLHDSTIAASGAAVQIAIGSHNAGYDDAPLYEGKVSKPYNLLPAYKRWLGEKAADMPTAHFYGDVSKCPDAASVSDGCQRYMMTATQGYAVKVVAQHLMAMCYYAQAYPENPVFERWQKYTGPGGYCEELDVPSPAALTRVKVGRACP